MVMLSKIAKAKTHRVVIGSLLAVPVMFDWGYYPKTQPCFPPLMIEKLIKQAKLSGILGDKHASGTDILEELGEEHIKTG